jgi:hypothetical protein
MTFIFLPKRLFKSSFTLLVGIKNGVTAMENNTKFPQKSNKQTKK